MVTITDDDETPVITGSATHSFAEIEYDADPMTIDLEVASYSATDADTGDTITWDLSGADAGKFELTADPDEDDTQVLSFKGDQFGDNKGPDFENPRAAGATNAYKVTVEASDGTNTRKRDVTVTVTGVNENPSITEFVFPGQVRGLLTLTEVDYEKLETTALRGGGLFEVIDPEHSAGNPVTFTWSLGGADASRFVINLFPGFPTARLTDFNSHPDYENPADADEDNDYEFIVQVSDGTNTVGLPHTARIININERPTITAPTVSEYKEIEYDFTGTPPAVGTFTATDPEGHELTFIEVDAAGDVIANAPYDIHGDTGILTFRSGSLPDFENPMGEGGGNTYVIRVAAVEVNRPSDPNAHDSFNVHKLARTTIRVRVTDANEKPEFIDTPATAIDWNENQAASVEIHDYNARDEEGAVDFALSGGADRARFNLTTDGKLTFKQPPSFEDEQDADSDGVYEVTITATDRESGTTRRSASLDVEVTVADLEEDGAITVSDLDPGVGGDTVRFTLTDPDGGIVVSATDKLTWTIQGSTDGTTWTDLVLDLDDPETSVAYLDYTPDEDHVGQQIRAMVSSYEDRRGTGKSATSEATRAVTADPKANVSPRWRSATEIFVPEDTVVPSNGLRVGELPTITDRDGDSVTYALGAGADKTLFLVQEANGQMWLLQEMDFETRPSIVVNIEVSDGKGVDTDNNVIADTSVDITIPFTLTVTDVEEDGVVTLSSDQPKTGVDITATLTDGDGGVSGETWQWARSPNGRTDWTNIGGADSATYTPVEEDEEQFLRARVEYTDRRGSGKFAERVTSDTAPSVNRKPRFPAGEDGARSVAENARGGSNIGAPVAAADPENNRLTYTLTGADAAAFTIVASSGQIRVKDALDFETKASYSVTVSVHDSHDPDGASSTAIDDTQDVTITVTNVNEAGVVTLTTATGVVQGRVETTATLSDPDGSVGDLTWQWAQSPNGRTNWANIADATTDTYTPTDTLVGRYIRATATYSDRLSGAGSATQTASAVSARVAAPPPVNSAPVFPASARAREVAEDAAAGDNVGSPVAATDLNSDPDDLSGPDKVNDALVYSLSGTDAASFAIDSSTGQLSLATGVTLDFETKRSYRVTVEVTDGYDALGDDEDPDVIDARVNVTINVTDVNEAPEIAADADTAVSVEENVNRAIATFKAADPERDTLTWSASLPEFWISARGELWFASPPDYEDSGVRNLTVTITATDPEGLTDTHSVDVEVTDLEEEGAIAVTPPRGWVDTQFTATLTDGDGGLTNRTWQWARSTNRSSWTDIPTATSNTYTAVADDVGNYLRISTEYTDRRGSGKTALFVMTVRIADSTDRPAANTAPAFPEPTAMRAIGQGTAPGRSIGSAVRAMDPDRNDILMYMLSGQDAGRFDIDPLTGQLLTRSVLDHDPDGQNTFTVTVNVHDGFDPAYGPSDAPDAMVEVTITVTAGNAPDHHTRRHVGVGGGGGGGLPPPQLVFEEGAETSRSVVENTPTRRRNRPTGYGDCTSRAPELTYTLQGADADLFTVDSETGQLRVGAAADLDYEGERKTYEVEVKAASSPQSSATIRVVISVTNLDLPGVVDDYDLNSDELISLEEAIMAVRDYFENRIGFEEVTGVIAFYFLSPAPA